jgi:hypothetical protein
LWRSTPSPEEGEADGRAFRANLDRAELSSRVRHVRLPSQRALAQVEGEIDLLYVDGSHRYRPARADLDRWGGRVRVGGSMLVHDAFSSIGVTLAIGRMLLTTSRFSYEGRTGSLAEYRRRRLGGAERMLNFVRQLAELPWFLRNLLVKVLLLARLGRAARLLGHREGPWPY